MKHLLTLSVVLALAISANAALLTENFDDQDVSDWTFISEDTAGYAAHIFVDQGGGDYAFYKPDYDSNWDIFTKGLSSAVSSGSVYIEATVWTSGGNGRPGGLGLLDATGQGAYLSLNAQGNASPPYMIADLVSMPDITTADDYWGLNVIQANEVPTDTTTEMVYKLEYNYGTDLVSLSVNGSFVSSATLGLGSLGPITTAAIVDKKRVYFDDVTVDIPEPASLALLGLGGLGVLIRRRK